MKRIFVILLAVASLLMLECRAQDYRFEVGPSLGMTGYLGDVNNSNMWKHPGITGGGMFRYIINSRWAVKGNLNYASISGNSADIDTKFPVETPYEFKSSLYDLGGQVEFNFFHFGSGPTYKHYKRLSPYMTVGLGAVMSSTSGHTNVALSLPLGVGVKYKLKERLNLGFEFTMRKSFGDKIDNLTDLYGVRHGIAKNTDWYSFAMFSVTYEFSKRCVKCHYID
ncbi:MAG: outer membrane beta-barrel protein [Bacteroidales bacterium]|nr:outer membrane beta-barrel protein [Candidatus Sodaliphilus limicaballi]